MEEIKLYDNKSAIKEIQESPLHVLENLVLRAIVHNWYTSNQPYCYILYNKEKKPVSYALMEALDFDPKFKHKNPKLINFLMTLDSYRRQGYANKLVLHIKERDEFSAFCSDESSEKLFEESGCINYGEWEHNVLYRYP